MPKQRTPRPKIAAAGAEVYAAVAARRTQLDVMLWQVPALSITAQAFLFTIALGPESRPIARILTCTLSLVVTFLTLHLFTRHRQAEIHDAHWLEEYERDNFGDIGAHGHTWQRRRNATSPDAWLFTGLARLGGYRTWAVGLSFFGVSAVVVLAISTFWPYLLQK